MATALEDFIRCCDELRIKAIDNGAIELNLLRGLQSWVHGGRHVFNIWREQFGGGFQKIVSSDPIIESLSKIALEIYPQLLIRFNGNEMSFLRLFFQQTILNLPDNERLLGLIKGDAQLASLFFPSFRPAEIALQTQVVNQFYPFLILPTVLIKNIAFLFKFTGGKDVQALLSCVESTLHILRNSSAQTDACYPFFIGFKNIGFLNAVDVDLFEGKIRPYSEVLYDFLSSECRPNSLMDGCVYESKSLNVKGDGLTQNELDEITGHLRWTLALSIERAAPVGLRLSWSYCFNPLSFQPGISVYNWPASPRPQYEILQSDVSSITDWSKVIASQNCPKKAQ